jgi:tRNA(His) 5'-end guanylyltransferase
MRFVALDIRLRKYETAYDFCIPPENYIVVRLDGRGFTRLTKDIGNLKRHLMYILEI